VTIQAVPFSDILVPLDGSPIAERALEPALELVRRTRVPLRVLRRSFADEAETAAAYLADVADRHAGVTDVETQVLDRDSVPDAIREGWEPAPSYVVARARECHPCSDGQRRRVRASHA
jgi:nucleotide-binding universal stress UspA family protein